MITREQVMDRLATVMDPELHLPITELGMVESVHVDGGKVQVGVKLTVAGCPLSTRIESEVTQAVSVLSGVTDVGVNLGVMTPEEREALAARLHPHRESVVTAKDSKVRVVICGSGKGGVGKSTITVNVAAALQSMGRAVGVLDADVYGFSVSRMLAARQQPVVLGDGVIVPVDVHNLRVMSMGMLVNEDTPVMWRGPMLHKLLDQFLNDVAWGEIEYLLIDAPPGTGDVAISLSQELPKARVLLVTTPQEAAARVAGRVAQMAGKVGQEVIGIIENMAYFRCTDCGKAHPIFGKGGAQRLAHEFHVPLLGQVPIDPQLPMGGDLGEPIVWKHPDSEAAQVFFKVAKAIDETDW
ncbi:MAG: Mrp/NBP35 family ATP-binding protein [Thermaerobacter sp.]|nr:Mrp/NBP35 family ATP-binding protein [Thermaerobacter sp.]